jgi:uncharacterized metal-binding protein YceD (DUF177 family)
LTSHNTARDPSAHLLRIADLKQSGKTAFDITFSSDELQSARDELDLVKMTKMRFRGTIAPSGTSDWELTAEVGASVVQSCVVTLAPVKTRIDEPVYRLYRKDMPEFEEGSVNEMELEDYEEPLGTEFDLFAIAKEAVSLALPPYPKAAGAKLESGQFAEEGVTPMTDDDAKPFASLAALKDNLPKE